jgi:hypothetical protein
VRTILYDGDVASLLPAEANGEEKLVILKSSGDLVFECEKFQRPQVRDGS